MTMYLHTYTHVCVMFKYNNSYKCKKSVVTKWTVRKVGKFPQKGVTKLNYF